MNTPTNHVTSLELSRRLEELKVPQNSHFVWFNNSGITGDAFWTLGYKEEIIDNGVTLYPEKTVSAYLASELGDMIYKNHKLMVCPNWEDRGVYRMQYDLQWWCEGKTLADVYAKMLIYLLENHLISVEELGK